MILSLSLYNVFYKIIAKVLVNCLKLVLSHVISESQSTFLSGRLITDNVVIAFETLHYLKQKTQGKSSSMALKLDMSKAYDRVEWQFLVKDHAPSPFFMMLGQTHVNG